MGLAFKIAWRFITSAKTQTILIIFGIAVGVAVQIFIGALIDGLQRSLIDKTIGSSSQITVTSNNDTKTISKPDMVISEIKSASYGIKNISTSVDASGFINYKNETEPVLVRGFDIENAEKIYKILEALYEGRPPEKEYEGLIGKELAEKLKIKVGESVLISTPQGGSEKLTVTGFFDLKVVAINKSWVVTRTKTVQNIFGFDNKVTSIEMQVDEVFLADKIAFAIQDNLSNKSLLVENWKDQNAQLLSGLNGQSVSSYMIQVFVLIAVTLGIASVLAVSVVQKSKQIGILKAIGIKNFNASMIFVFKGLGLGVFGASLGIAFGFGLLFMFSTFARSSDGTPVAPIFINWTFISVSALIAVSASVLAAIVPAKLSAKLSPIEVIRNG